MMIFIEFWREKNPQEDRVWARVVRGREVTEDGVWVERPLYGATVRVRIQPATDRATVTSRVKDSEAVSVGPGDSLALRCKICTRDFADAGCDSPALAGGAVAASVRPEPEP